MEQWKTISGQDAIDKMRKVKLIPGAVFGIRFITCDLSRNEFGEVRVYEECRLRAARRNEGLSVDPDHYLFFSVLPDDEPRQCFKKLIRAVCFPPSFDWLKVNWFL